MTANDALYPRLELVIKTFADWLKHRREIIETLHKTPAR